MSYEDTVLIKLRRDYSKDEVVMYALNEIQRLKIESGKDKAYIEELETEKKSFNHWLKKTETLKFNSTNKDLINQINILKQNIIKLKNQTLTIKSLDKISKVEHIKKKTDSLENKLKKQIEHGERMSSERLFIYNFLKENVSEEKLQE